MAVYDLDGSKNESDADAGITDTDLDKHDPSSRSIFVNSGGENAAESSQDEEKSKKRKRSPTRAISKLVWSEGDSTSDAETAYKKFKARKTKGRSRAVRSGKRARAIEAESSRREIETNGESRRGPRNSNARKWKEKTYGDVSSEDDLMEWTVPEYLQKRRKNFDDRVERLKQGGLSLPPTYNDLYFSDDENLEQINERPIFSLLKPCAEYKDIPLPYSLGLIPAPIAQWLRDYQVRGAAFLHELFVYQKGGILGDDMGLGKTVQVIAFLTAAYGKTGDERDRKRMRKMRNEGEQRWYPRTLIICPGALMANWQDELQRWGWWHADIYHGTTAAKEATLLAAMSGRLEIMITTYTTYRMSKEAINMVPWDCVVADECHVVKERKSETTQSLNEVNALCRIGLTGTAIQNKYEELWTLLNWTNPGRFGPISTWKASICEPLKLGQSHDATVYQLSRARKTAKQLVENLLPQFFLRRMKSLIKDQLPKKSDRVVFSPLTPTQAQAYENFLASEIVGRIKHSGDLCECGSGKKSGWCCRVLLDDDSKWQTWVFPAIVTLQKLANHLAILIPQGTDTQEKQAKDLGMLQIALPDKWEELYRTRDNIVNYANPEFCGKWRILKKLLKFWHEEGGNKVLVFSHSVRLLKMLQMLFTSTSYTVAYLDGSMKYEDRYNVVSDFNADPSQFVFLISTRAGGVGLNITSANKVVVVDPNWNPSYDLQAQDRAYRIGQTRDVEVFRLVSQGTLEEIVYARQIYKQQQASIVYNASSERRYFQGVQDRSDKKGEIFGLTNLFAYQNDNIVLRDIVNKTNIAESRAGIRVADVEFDDNEIKAALKDEDTSTDRPIKQEPESEDSAISQLAAEIIGEYASHSRRKAQSRATPTLEASSARKHDPVAAILSSAGVQYTHENSEVVGSSKVEAELSKRAEDAAGLGATQEQEARVFWEESESQGKTRPGDSVNGSRSATYRYRPPDDVKRRHFCSMAKWAGHEDPVEFALVIEAWTQEGRREFLSQFYQSGRGQQESKVGEDLEHTEGDRAVQVAVKHEEGEDDEL